MSLVKRIARSGVSLAEERGWAASQNKTVFAKLLNNTQLTFLARHYGTFMWQEAPLTSFLPILAAEKKPAHTHSDTRAQTQYQGLMNTLLATGKVHTDQEGEPEEPRNRGNIVMRSQQWAAHICCHKFHFTANQKPKTSVCFVCQETPQRHQRTCRREAGSCPRASGAGGPNFSRESTAQRVVFKSAFLAHLYFTIHSPQADK